MQIRQILLLGMLLLAGLVAQAQSKYTINGRVTDDAGEPLGGASVMLLHAKDSILQSFALTGPDGKFRFEDVPADAYVFKSNYLKHKSAMVPLNVGGDQAEISMPEVKMTPEGTTLGDVEITDERIPIRIKGDTIEYDAKAFKTQEGDNVEELLKKLPGMEVDNDGNIKAQGTSVVKVLVDGKEFFGDDPKVASKNLPSKAIDKVQVFDKRSEMADFTGIDDGTRDRTINLTLKEEYKKGYFGNVMAGYGSKDRYEAKANLNRFAEKSQLSFLGQANNTNQQGFSFQDYTNFIGGMSNLMRGGNQSGASQLGLNLSSDPNSGFFTTAAGGLNGNWDVGKKTRITTSYFYNSLGKNLDRVAWKQTVLENQSYETNENGTQQDVNSNHRLNLQVRHDLDSLTRISLRGTFARNATTSDVNNLTQSNLLGGASNSSDQTSNSQGSSLDINSNLNLMHKFRKTGRSFNLSGNFKLNPNSKDYGLRSINGFSFADTLPTFQDTIRQSQNESVGYLSVGGSGSYAEPIGKHSVMDGTITYQQTNNSTEKQFFDLNQEGTTSVLNQNLSNSYTSLYRYGRAGLSWRYFTSRSNLSLGLALQKSELKGELLLTNTPILKDFLNVLPSLEYRLSLSKNQRLLFRYNTKVNEPSVTQLQPIPDNSNPLNISVGNPDLGAEYAHSLRANYNLFDQFSFTSFFANLTSTYTQNKISSLTTVDSLLRQVTKPVNVKSDLNLRADLNFSSPIRKLQMKITLNGNSSFSRSIVFINGVENFVNRYTEGGEIKLENKKKDHFDAAVGARTSFTLSKYPEAATFDQSYLNSGLFANVLVFLPKKFTVFTGIDASIYTGGGFNSNQVVPLWRAYVAKKVFKSNRGEFKVAAFDLLNRNVGISRTAQLNYQQEERVNTLSRYFLGSFSYAIVAIGKK